MTTYKIIATSWTLWIVSLVAILIGGILILIKIHPPNITWTIISVILLFAFAVLLQRYTSRAKIEITTTNDSFSIKWQNQFIFHSNPDKTIPFAEIRSFKYQPDPNFDLFELTLNDGTDLRIWHFTFTYGDDFDKLMADFPPLIERYNERKSTSEDDLSVVGQRDHKIERAKTIFESQVAPYLAGFAILLIVALPVILYINPSEKPKNPFLLLAPLSGAIYFLVQFFKTRNKKND